MPEIIKRKKALSVSPLKVSQTVGGALAFLGMEGAVPLMHGAQGCTAFGKVFLVRHFREPIPLQTTAMDQVSAVMGADPSVVEALATIAQKSSPKLIGVVSTGLAETQGCHLSRAVDNFRQQHPEYSETPVVALNTPDYTGCLESGFAAAVEAMIRTLTPEQPGTRQPYVNVLASVMLTPGDIEELEELIESFGLIPRVVPNLSGSLGGHLDSSTNFCPTTTGGTSVSAIRDLGHARLTIAVGRSMYKAAKLLEKRTGVPTCFVPHLHTLPKVDVIIHELLHVSERDVPPPRLLRSRDQLRDALLDTHFSLGMRKVGVASDPDLLFALTELIHSVGGQVVAAVAPYRGPAVNEMPTQSVFIGDLEDLEREAINEGVEFLMGSSHAAELSHRLSRPLVRVGFPLFDCIGRYRKRWIGYRGIRDTLFELSNICHELHSGEIAPYHSVLSQKTEFKSESTECSSAN